MRCLKCAGKYQPRIAFGRGGDVQVFQHGKFLIYCRDELLQIRKRHVKADTAHAIAVLECKHYSRFILRGDAVIAANVIDNERKRG
jgi:hypothetical protein